MSEFHAYLAHNENFLHNYILLRICFLKHASDPIFFWEAGKAIFRGKIIAYTSHFEKASLQPYRQASEGLYRAQDYLPRSGSLEHKEAFA